MVERSTNVVTDSLLALLAANLRTRPPISDLRVRAGRTLKRALTSVATRTLDKLTSCRAAFLQMRSSAAPGNRLTFGHRVVAIPIARFVAAG